MKIPAFSSHGCLMDYVPSVVEMLDQKVSNHYFSLLVGLGQKCVEELPRKTYWLNIANNIHVVVCQGSDVSIET